MMCTVDMGTAMPRILEWQSLPQARFRELATPLPGPCVDTHMCTERGLDCGFLPLHVAAEICPAGENSYLDGLKLCTNPLSYSAVYHTPASLIRIYKINTESPGCCCCDMSIAAQNLPNPNLSIHVSVGLSFLHSLLLQSGQPQSHASCRPGCLVLSSECVFCLGLRNFPPGIYV